METTAKCITYIKVRCVKIFKAIKCFNLFQLESINENIVTNNTIESPVKQGTQTLPEQLVHKLYKELLIVLNVHWLGLFYI